MSRFRLAQSAGSHGPGDVVLQGRRMCFLNSERAQLSFHEHNTAPAFFSPPQRHGTFAPPGLSGSRLP